MSWKKITAIVRNQRLQPVEERLQQMGVKGLTVNHVKGFGEYANFFRRDWMVRHVRLEIFAHDNRSQEIIEAILEVASTGSAGDGIVAVQSVEELFRIRQKTPAEMEDI